MNCINIADLKVPNDFKDRTYREINNDITHNIPIGSLVELNDGVRLWVVYHARDCDGTPLYELSVDKNNIVKERDNFRNYGWIGGYSEDSLKII